MKPQTCHICGKARKLYRVREVARPDEAAIFLTESEECIASICPDMHDICTRTFEVLGEYQPEEPCPDTTRT